MVSLDDFNLVELVFGESGSTLELIFAASALIGGVLFLFWFLLMLIGCLLYTSPSPRDRTRSRMPSSA